MNDKWKQLRQNLYRNKEPQVNLIGITNLQDNEHKVEETPAIVARKSHESKGDYNDNIRLNKDLIRWGHHTPLEFVNIILEVDGISKSALTQWDRQRIGIGFVQRSTRYVPADQNEFIYPMYDYIDDEQTVIELLKTHEEIHIEAIETYKKLFDKKTTKQDARKIMPVSFSSGTFVNMNARSLRHFFELRLEKHAEWEIRRIACMIWDLIYPLFPSLLDDLKYLRDNNK